MFEAIELKDKDAAPSPGLGLHSVLTLNPPDDDSGGMTKQTEQRVIAFFKQSTGA